MRLLESQSLRLTPTGADSNAATQELKNQLQAQLAEWHAVHRKFEPAQAWLEGGIAFSDGAQKADLEARKLEIHRKTREAERRIAQVNADIAALAERHSAGAV